MLCTDSTVNAWGWNTLGQLGNGTGNTNVPVAVDMLSGVSDIGAGVDHSIALLSDNTVWAWGYNMNGELGNGTVTNTNIPTQVSGLTDIVAISSMYHSLALKQDSTVCGWGNNDFGQLGTGVSGGFSNIPIAVSALSSITSIACGYYHSLAIKSDSTVWAWGYGLANGTYMNSNVPAQISSLTGMVSVAGGNTFSLALKSDSTVWAWGSNNEGELGDGTTTNSIVPVQVSGLTGVVAIACGVYHSLALKSDGTVWTWGFNLSGQLGDGTNIDSHVPVQVADLTDVVSIAGGYGHSIAMKSDGTGWAWGANTYGQLGDGSNAGSTIPLQISGLCTPIISVNEIAEPLSITVFPNPSAGVFVIRLDNAIKNGEVEIFNVEGTRIFKEKMSHTAYKTIDLTNFSAGIYLLKLHDERQCFYKKMVIENN